MFPVKRFVIISVKEVASQYLGTIPVANDDPKSRESFCGLDTLKLGLSITSGTQSTSHCLALRHPKSREARSMRRCRQQAATLWPTCLHSTQAPPSLGGCLPWSLAVPTTFLCKHPLTCWHDQRWSNFPHDNYTALPRLACPQFQLPHSGSIQTIILTAFHSPLTRNWPPAALFTARRTEREGGRFRIMNLRKLKPRIKKKNQKIKIF